MEDELIIAPVGPCPITGYPLVAVNGTTGRHVGVALAQLEELETTVPDHPRDPDQPPPPPPIHFEDILTKSELIRSWTELLVMALRNRMALTPSETQRDQARLHDLIRSQHHYDTNRIAAALNYAAAEHLNERLSWTNPGMVLIPDVGLHHLRTAATATVAVLAGREPVAETFAMLRAEHLNLLLAEDNS